MVSYVSYDLTSYIQYFICTFMDRVGTLDFRGRDKNMDNIHIAIKADVHVLLL
jgi:hypothetical protein